MTDITTVDWWELLPADIRRQVDGYVLQDARLSALRVVFEAGRTHGLGLQICARASQRRSERNPDQTSS
ncbi:hypothetical protein [Streptomyces sp. NBC_00057]|uniref:hypothetical protein n=1 Tax=Streptomyces sp. NBC_00057 TaxID=2975634 RepID=UPI00324BAF76